MSKIDFDGVIGLIGVTVGLVGIGYALGTHSKMAKISENLDRSIDELASQTPINIPQDMIERAVEKNVAYEVKEAVRKTTDDIKLVMKNDIHAQVKHAVDDEYSKIKDTVLDELVTEAAKIDASRVRSDVERAAKEKALSKFNHEVDGIIDDFKEKLEDYIDDCKENIAVVNKVYKSFAEAVEPSNRERVIHIR